MNQKKYFKKKLDGVQYTIWDLEFKRAKTQSIREEVRMLYTDKKTKLELVEVKLKAGSEPGGLKEKNLDEYKRIEDEKTLLERDIKRHESQMKDLDTEVNGAGPSSEYPTGVQGINDQLDALRQLKGMLAEYIKQI